MALIFINISDNFSNLTSNCIYLSQLIINFIDIWYKILWFSLLFYRYFASKPMIWVKTIGDSIEMIWIVFCFDCNHYSKIDNRFDRLFEHHLWSQIVCSIIYFFSVLVFFTIFPKKRQKMTNSLLEYLFWNRYVFWFVMSSRHLIRF